ncbi:NAD-dependent epimerase/dehydratase family protein [Pararhodonellum marinum]|uniref:NAD-dependent epimerase/dehydratase family protein n=1 Tax=Pararhodonellum marinum TaxID=2755358 RepID=UPI00188FCA56|nr:NAD(P)-dependent oxidoreductase [Pararhodonellum marinum]
MPKVLITGGGGFIGKNVIPYLQSMNAELFFLGQKPYKEYDLPNARYIPCNLMDEVQVSKALGEIQGSHLVHLAWSVTPSSYNLPENLEWVQASMHLLETFHKNGGKRILMAGSCYEYEWGNSYCHEDKTSLGGATLYGRSKNILWQYAKDYCQTHGMELAWARLFFLYGPHEKEVRLIPHVITSLLKGQTATIRNGEVYRDYQNAKEAGNYLSKLVFHEFTGPINVCTGIPTKLAVLGKMAAEIIGYPELLKIESPTEVPDRVLFGDPEKLNQVLGKNSKENLKAGLEETIEWWKFHLKQNV